MKRFLLKPWLIASIILPVISACHSDRDPEPELPGETPEEKQSVEFAITVDQFTTLENDRIELRSDAKVPVITVINNDTTVYDYTYKGGTLTASSPFVVTKGHDPVSVSALYGIGVSSENIPGTWSIPTDQSNGYTDGYLLYANCKVEYGKQSALALSHQTAKLIFRIKFEGTASEYYSISDITVGNSDLSSTGRFKIGGASVSWTPGTPENSVKPLRITTYEGFDATVSALLIPQNLSGKQLLNLTISNGDILSWIAPEGTTLLPGSCTSFDATVSADLKTLTVTKIEGASWEEGENRDIVSEEENIDYGEVKIGDYYYSDGSWSNGGLIEISKEGHGKLIWESPKPMPQYVNPVTGNVRKVIGVVFEVDPSRIGNAERDVLAEKGVAEPHGLVISTSLIEQTQWDRNSNDETEIGIPSIIGTKEISLFQKANADISGLSVCSTILSKRGSEIADDNYLAITDARSMQAPVRSSGWFIASGGQWFDMLRNFTGLDFTDQAPFYFTSNTFENEDYTHFDWQLDFNLALQAEYNENIVELLNYPFSTIIEKDNFEQNQNFITSTMCDAGNLYYTNVFPKYITFRRAAKNYWIMARPILAF